MTTMRPGRTRAAMDANEQRGFLRLPDERVKAATTSLASPNYPPVATYDK